MVIDETLLVLVAGMAAAGAFLILTFCAGYVQIQKTQVKLMAIEAQKRKRQAQDAMEPPIEVS